jgi:hypothetical protein
LLDLPLPSWTEKPHSFLFPNTSLPRTLIPGKQIKGSHQTFPYFGRRQSARSKTTSPLLQSSKPRPVKGSKAFPFGTTPLSHYHMSSPNTKPHGNTPKLISWTTSRMRPALILAHQHIGKLYLAEENGVNSQMAPRSGLNHHPLQGREKNQKSHQSR